MSPAESFLKNHFVLLTIIWRKKKRNKLIRQEEDGKQKKKREAEVKKIAANDINKLKAAEIATKWRNQIKNVATMCKSSVKKESVPTFLLTLKGFSLRWFVAPSRFLSVCACPVSSCPPRRWPLVPKCQGIGQRSAAGPGWRTPGAPPPLFHTMLTPPPTGRK